jgi:hypothetical protein
MLFQTSTSHLHPPPSQDRNNSIDLEQQQQHQQTQGQEEVIPIPQPGDRAPPLAPTSTLTTSGPLPTPLTPSAPIVTFPRAKPVLAVFLRHCGCPFAEKTFRRLADVANQYRDEVTCVAVSQAGREETEKWYVRFLFVPLFVLCCYAVPFLDGMSILGTECKTDTSISCQRACRSEE